MKNSQRGFVMPLLLALIAILLVGGGVYVYENKKVEAPATVVDTGTQQSDQNQQQANTQTLPVTNTSMTGWKTYTNTRNGYQLKYPADWQTEENLGVSVRIFNPRAQGKPDTDQPSEAFRLAFKQTPCQLSNWEVGFGLVNYKTACVAANPMIEIGMVAFSDQTKIIEDQILSTIKFTQPTSTAQNPNLQTANWKTYTNTREGVSFQYLSEWLLKYVEQNSADDPFGAARILEEETFNHDLSVNNSFGTFYINNLLVQGKSGLVTPQEYMSYPLSVSSTKEWKHINGIPVLYTVVSRKDFLSTISYSMFTSEKEYLFNFYPERAFPDHPASLTQKDLDSIEKIISTFTLSNPSEKFVEFPLPPDGLAAGRPVVNGPMLLAVGQTGTWEITKTGATRFAVIWADGTPVNVGEGSGIPYDSEFTTNPSFAHAFSKPGTYFVQFFAKVLNGTGNIGAKGLEIWVR